MTSPLLTMYDALLELARSTQTRTTLANLEANLQGVEERGVVSLLSAFFGHRALPTLNSRGAQGLVLDRWASGTPEGRRGDDSDGGVYCHAAEALSDALVLFHDAKRSELFFAAPFPVGADDDPMVYRTDYEGLEALDKTLSQLVLDDCENLAELPVEHLGWQLPTANEYAKLPELPALRSLSLGIEELSGEGLAALLACPSLVALELTAALSDAHREALQGKEGLLSLRCPGLTAPPDSFENQWQGNPLAPNKGLAALVWGRAITPEQRFPRWDATRARALQQQTADRGLVATAFGGFMHGLVEDNLHSVSTVVGVPVASAARSASLGAADIDTAKASLSALDTDTLWRDLAASTGQLRLERQDDQLWLCVAGKLNDSGGRLATLEQGEQRWEARTGDRPTVIRSWDADSELKLKCGSWKW